MTQSAYLILAAVVVLQTKHLLADFVFQTLYQVKFKGVYGHPGGIIHAGIHAIGSIPVFLLITPSIGLGAALVVTEFLLHYHIDWGKEQLGRRFQLQPTQAQYWWVFGLDQWLHQLTYLGYVVVLASA